VERSFITGRLQEIIYEEQFFLSLCIHNKSMLVIPDEILVQAKMTETELRQEIAVNLYAGNKLSFGQAQKLTNLNHFEFQKLLDEKGVNLHYSLEDLKTDMHTLDDLHKK
jgi:predicted HTH domain antitoxin